MEDDVIMPPVHPGEILLAEFLEPLELSQYQLARSIAVPPKRINASSRRRRPAPPPRYSWATWTKRRCPSCIPSP